MASPSPHTALYASYTIDLNKTHQESLYDHQYSSPPFSKNPVPDHIVFNSYMGSQLHPTLKVCKSEIYDQEALDVNKGSVKCPKLRFTICKREGVLEGGDEDQTKNRDFINNNNNNNNNNNDNATIRVCSDCNTTKTPLWRSGPKGPKSLCNACGIRQRKARRAISVATNGSLAPNWMCGSIIRAENRLEKGSTNTKNGVGAMKKRSKIVKPTRQPHYNVAQRKLWFEEFAKSMTTKLSLQQVFPKEEKEAAILLMALSCGLVR